MRVCAREASGKTRYNPSINSGEVRLDSIDKLFYHLLPPRWVEDGLKYTNRNLDEHDAAHLKLTKGEWLRWWGMSLAISLNTGVPVEKMWPDTPIPESVLPPPRMGRHGMSKNRWQAIKAALAFGPSDTASFEADEWCFVQPLVDAFNEQMAEAINPGWMLCVDESMCAWRGKVGKGDRYKIPKLSWVPRKLEPLGAELKASGDALLGVILRLEICKGKETHAGLEYFKEKARDGVEYGHTVSTMMRLVKLWFGTERVVGGDSWFAQVKGAEALAEKGLYFMGDVKTATRRFCGQALEEATGLESGAWATFTSELKLGGDKTIPIYAVSHRRGETVHKFVSTCGTTLRGGAHVVYFEDEEERAHATDETVFEITRKCPKILNDWTLAQPCINRNNHYRQFLLAMEKRILTIHQQLLASLRDDADGHAVHQRFLLPPLLQQPDCGLQGGDGEARLPAHAQPARALPLAPALGPDPPLAGLAGLAGLARRRAAARAPAPADLQVRQGAQHRQAKKSHLLRCVCCNKPTAWYCITCTKGPHEMCPVCPSETRGGGKGGKGTKVHP